MFQTGGGEALLHGPADGGGSGGLLVILANALVPQSLGP